MRESFASRHRGLVVGMGLGMALLASTAGAQSLYRCTTPSGTVQWSDRPCAADAKPATPGGSGNAAAPRTPNRSSETDFRYSQHLSPNCARLYDALDTGQARGLRYADMERLQTEYIKSCAAEDAAARRRVLDDWRADNQRKQSEQQAQQRDKQRQTMSREQCAEMLRIVHAKRQQLPTMTAGEKADFTRFEANYNARCGN
jgi:hypothetical protein